MVIAIVLIVILIIFGIIYWLLFKEYANVMAIFETLIKVLDTRNLVLMRILSEIKDKQIKNEMSNLVAQRLDTKQLYNDKLIELDVKMNKKLDRIYSELDKSKNPIVKEELKKLINFEKNLKKIRREYNKVVDEYNDRIVKHPKLMMKFLKMRPFNTYDIKQ